jgi:acyl-CoA synthetase (AMP-forming)/AMP-acid ligase II
VASAAELMLRRCIEQVTSAEDERLSYLPQVVLRELPEKIEQVAYCELTSAQAAAYHRVETLRDPSHARALSLTELRELFARAGLAKPEVTRYELPVEIRIVDELPRTASAKVDLAAVAALFAEG